MPTTRTGSWRCACGAILTGRTGACPDCGTLRHGVEPPPTPITPRPTPERRTHTVCPVHHGPLDATGFCAVAQAWWYPKFACPACAGPLWDNGFCANCTPKTRHFMGDYFEQLWTAEAGPAYGHYVRVSKGPTPVPTPLEVASYLAELRRVTIGRDLPAPETTP
jgi:hypothetical protein